MPVFNNIYHISELSSQAFNFLKASFKNIKQFSIEILDINTSVIQSY